MSNNTRKDDEPESSPQSSKQGKVVPLPPAGEVVVNLDEAAAKPPAGKQIHRRRPLPPVPEKDEPPTPPAGS